MALNRVVLHGRLTKDPELKYTPAGVPVATTSIAVDRFTKDESGNYETDFFNVTAWRRTAEFLHNYLKKGREVVIEGRLQTRSWVDQATGMKRSAVDVVADNVDSCGPRPVEDAVPDAATTYQATAPDPVVTGEEVLDDPFADE